MKKEIRYYFLLTVNFYSHLKYPLPVKVSTHKLVDLFLVDSM